jgi:VanZ family protein
MKVIKIGLRRWAPAIILMAVIFVASSTPGNDIPGFGIWDTIVKKGAHMTGYALLAVSYLYALANSRKTNRLILLLAILLAGLFAATDEFHQSFTPGRNPSVADVGIDAVGAVIGALIWARIKVSSRT